MKHIVKRAGHSETFDERKLYASIYASCLSVQEQPATAELIAQKVTESILAWINTKTEVTSNDIRRAAGQYLCEHNRHAGYLYLHHRIMW